MLPEDQQIANLEFTLLAFHREATGRMEGLKKQMHEKASMKYMGLDDVELIGGETGLEAEEASSGEPIKAATVEH